MKGVNMLTEPDSMMTSQSNKKRVFVASSVAMYPTHLYVRIQAIITRVLPDAEVVFAKGLYGSMPDFMMKYRSVLDRCDELVFFATPDEHTIGRACWFEIEYMLYQAKPVQMCTWHGVLVPYTELAFTQLHSWRHWMEVNTLDGLYSCGGDEGDDSNEDEGDDDEGEE